MRHEPTIEHPEDVDFAVQAALGRGFWRLADKEGSTIAYARHEATLRDILDAPRLAEENERLRALLSRFTDKYHQIFKSIEDSPNYVWMMLPRELLKNINAALASKAGDR